MLKCTLNGREVEVKEGTTIIEAFYQNKIDIAHYCWHPGLSIAGVCRLCMVEIEGNPRLQIACNTVVTEGMKVNNQSAKVKEAVKWGLDFHLINHPLDCPICDQAGECGLQDQYMKYGQYDSEMAEAKQKKHKVVDLGPRVVLDSERCILCSRCVRFTDEVSKTNELGIFNRGDRAEIGTFNGKPLNNKYSLNTVDICPVGALTSKDFRFRQRVWFLKDAETVCTGCSTGCNIKVHYNREGLFRVKPVYNAEVNGHWMCDEGRDVYKFVNKESRLLDARVVSGGKAEHMTAFEAAKRVGEKLKGAGKSVGLVLTGSYTVEEYEAIMSYFKTEVGTDRVFHWINNPESFESFDGLLLRGDRNPNTRGLVQALQKHGFSAQWKELTEALSTGSIQTLVVAGPENQVWFPDFKVKVAELAKATRLVWMTSGKSSALDELKGEVTLIPLKSYIEKSGTFVNHAGRAQSIRPVTSIVKGALSLTEVVSAFRGEALQATEVVVGRSENEIGRGRIHNEFTLSRGAW
ncbi:MAG TPA: 2Fe-2S iron-sulfur cluster-binding protein [Pseudobdellovibrionaceae bacterium]|nr:2Fe-2S iron-sulfur cluster-binding protein [Pseudobdellovibrionaceae bacterium]